jgi:predicted GH43/DUF377 family glycosyl hydrolase
MGAGSVPISLGGGRYLVIYHVGERMLPQSKYKLEYTLGAALFNMAKLPPDAAFGPGADLGAVVEHRMERMMVPETPWELEGPSKETVANVLFTCGTYEYRGDIYIIYGGADTYTMAARVNTGALLAALEQCDKSNPYIQLGEDDAPSVASEAPY